MIGRCTLKTSQAAGAVQQTVRLKAAASLHCFTALLFNIIKTGSGLLQR
jgi:hypothetical protein